MSEARYYIDVHGHDANAYRYVIRFACGLASGDPNIRRIVLLADSEQNTGWLASLFGEQVYAQMLEGATFRGCNVPLKIEIIASYPDNFDEEDVVIGMGLDADALSQLDTYSMKALIVIPWTKESVQAWMQKWGPTEIRVD
jgi:hypothetical protein